MKTFYIADTHFGHENVIKFDRRPFASMDEMHSTMIERWNSVVGDKDHVYILGDFLWKGLEASRPLLKELRGKKRLIVGNHDVIQNTQNGRNHFLSIDLMKTFKVRLEDGQRYHLMLSHFPVPWSHVHRKERGIHLYGHVHLTKEFDHVMRARKALMDDPLTASSGLMFNVGANLPYMDYTPRTLEEIIREGSIFNKEYDEGLHRELLTQQGVG